MSSSFSNALSGLKANSLAIDTVSGNLANLNTTGYMDSQVSFQDLLSGVSSAGGTSSVSGSVVAQTTTQFSQGSIQTTSQPFDAAIQGGGFFVLSTPSGQQSFTREGNFTVNSSGELLGAGGENVQGWNAAGGALSTSGATGNIVLPVSGSQQPVATTNMTISANLDSNTAVNGTFSSPIQVFDAQGNGHTLTVTYTETSPNNWSYNVTVPAADVGAPAPDPVVGSGTLTFDGTGKLITPAATDPPTAIAITGLADGASDMNINWNLYDAQGTCLL